MTMHRASIMFLILIFLVSNRPTLALNRLLEKYSTKEKFGLNQKQPTISRLGTVTIARMPYAFRGNLYFPGYDPIHGVELWRSDGTATGTYMVTDLNQNGEGFRLFAPGHEQYQLQIVEMEGSLYFAGYDNAGQPRLMQSDGTSQGTGPVGHFTFQPDAYYVYNDRLFWSSRAETIPQGLWSTDGTYGGTVLLKGYPTPERIISTFVGMGEDIYYFVYNDASRETVLWKSNGTMPGTLPVKELVYPQDTFPVMGAVFGNRLFFNGYDPSHGFELWQTDGTTKGTDIVQDYLPDSVSLHPNFFVSGADTLFFTSNEASSKTYVYKYINQEKGIQQIGELPSIQGGLKNISGRIYFWAGNGTPEGTSLFRINDTGDGVVSLMPPGGHYSAGYNYGEMVLAELGNQVFFEALDAEHGKEIWVTDGSPEGTHLLADILTEPEHSTPMFLTAAGGRVFFRADDSINGEGLWVYDPLIEKNFLPMIQK